MTFDLRIDEAALREIDQFAAYQKNYSETFALEQIDRLNGVFHNSLMQSPATWGYFFVTGAPYRAYLFRVGRRTSYWIVYIVDEAARRVDVLRFWNASRKPSEFTL